MKTNIRQLKLVVLTGILALSLVNNASADKYSGAAKEQCKQSGRFLDGHCVEVDNHLLFVKSYGPKSDHLHPAVVFLSGSGNTHYVWKKVAPSVAKFAHVVVYDKTGYGYSQKYNQPKPLTAPIVVENLQQLLKKIKIPPPYILVGHSHGGIYAQYFALTKPNQVRSLVLLDSSTYHLLRWERFSHYKPSNEIKNTEPFYYEALGITPSLQSVKTKMIEKGDKPFGDIPLMVLAAKEETDLGYFTQSMMKDWQVYQKKLSQSSTKSELHIVDSGHFIQIDRPELVIRAIKQQVLGEF